MEHTWQTYIPPIFTGLLLNVEEICRTELPRCQALLPAKNLKFYLHLFGQRNTLCAITEEVIPIADSTRQSCELRTSHFTYSFKAFNVRINISVIKAQRHKEFFIKKKNKEE